MADLVAMARAAAERYGVNPDIFVRQINQESGFNPWEPDGSPRRSPAGALGIAQFMPATAAAMGVDPADPADALDGAARLMRQNLDRYGGDYAKALAAYNAGAGAVDMYGGVPPYAETQAYVASILGGLGDVPASVPAAGSMLSNLETSNLAIALLVAAGAWILIDWVTGG